MGGRHKFKRGGHSVNAKQHLQNMHRRGGHDWEGGESRFG